METAVIKHLCLVVIVLGLSLSGAVGNENSPLLMSINGIDMDAVGDLSCPNDTSLCPDGFTLMPSLNCYYFSCFKETWDGALELCRRMGATLAYPQNIVEDSTLSNYLRLKFKGTVGWWLGASDKVTEGKWLWAHDSSVISYTGWDKGQPSNTGSNEDCLEYGEDYNWKWNDITCDSLLPFICQQI